MQNNTNLIEFIPGTKAKASEINYNFKSLKDAVNSNVSYMQEAIEEAIQESVKKAGAFIGAILRADINYSPAGWYRRDGSAFSADTLPNLISDWLLKDKDANPVSQYGNDAQEFTSTTWTSQTQSEEFTYKVNRGRLNWVTPDQREILLEKWDGNCPHLCYDIANNIIYMPQVKAGVHEADLGDGVITCFNFDQITNITGSMQQVAMHYEISGTGCITGAYVGSGDLQGANGRPIARFDIDASRSVRTGDSVRPKHIQYPSFICLANIAVEASQENRDLFINALDFKASADMSNVPDAVKAQIAHLASPASTGIVTIANNIEVTAPFDGFVCASTGVMPCAKGDTVTALDTETFIVPTKGALITQGGI